MPFTVDYANQILRETVVDNPAYLSLHSGVPTLLNELTGLSYSRQLTTFDEPDGFTLNTSVVAFGPLAANAIGIKYVGIWDALTEGTCMYYQAASLIADPEPIATGDTVDWGIGDISVNVQGG